MGKELSTKAAEPALEDLNQADHYYNQGLTWDIKGNFEQAVFYYTKALEINPRHAQACNNLAWLMATCPDGRYRNGPKAVVFAETAVALNRKPDFLDTLAAAYAEAGNFEKAREIENSVVHDYAEKVKTEKMAEYHARLSCYEGHTPWRKTNGGKAHSPSALKAEPEIPGQASEKNSVNANQDIISDPNLSPDLTSQAIDPGAVSGGADLTTAQDSRPEKVSSKASEKVSQQKVDPAEQPTTVPPAQESAGTIGTSKAEHAGDKTHRNTTRTFYPYTIHVSSYLDKEKSNNQAAELKDQGAPAFACPAWIPGKGDWYRVFIGWYETIEETRKAASELRGKQDIHPLELKMPYAVQVGIFDSDVELKKLEADLRSKAYITYRIPDGKPDHRVRLLIGAYKSEEDASRLAQQLEAEGFRTKVVLR